MMDDLTLDNEGWLTFCLLYKELFVTSGMPLRIGEKRCVRERGKKNL